MEFSQMKQYLRSLDDFEIKQNDSIIELSVASQTPYMREDDGKPYWQVLIISEDAIDFERLVDQKCPLLYQHDLEKQVGVVQKAFIRDKKLIVQVRFSQSEFAQSVKKDILSGIRRNVSIGYMIYDVEIIKGEDGIPIWNCIKWLPYEVSTVSVPADHSVGYKRSLDLKDSQDMKKFKKNLEQTQEEIKELEATQEEIADETKAEETEEVVEQIVEETTETVEDIPAEEEKEIIEEEVPEEETKEEVISEQEEIKAAGQLAGEEELAEECIKEKRSLAEFKSLLKKKRSMKNIKKENKTMEKFSISKAIRNASSQYKKDISNEYETKVIEENKRSLGIGDEADIVVRKSQLRALANATGKGAELVATDYLPQEFTPALRPQHTLEQTGYYTIPVNGNAVQFCVMEEGATASMYDLDGELEDGDLTFSTRTLTPKKGGVVIPIPYSLILQGRPQVDAIVEADIVDALTELRDKMILVGTGADNQPKGIVNTTGVNKVDYADAFTWQGVCTMEKLIRDANIFAPLCWVMNSTNKVKYETTLKDANGFEGYICTDDKIKNMPVYVNNALGDDEIILGAFENVAVADFDAIQLKVDDITLAKKQAIQVIASNAFDVVIRRPKAFTVTKGA